LGNLSITIQFSRYFYVNVSGARDLLNIYSGFYDFTKPSEKHGGGETSDIGKKDEEASLDS